MAMAMVMVMTMMLSYIIVCMSVPRQQQHTTRHKKCKLWWVKAHHHKNENQELRQKCIFSLYFRNVDGWCSFNHHREIATATKRSSAAAATIRCLFIVLAVVVALFARKWTHSKVNGAMAVVWFHFCRFHHFTKLNAWHGVCVCVCARPNERRAVRFEVNNKRIWLHLKCTMAFIHSTIWIVLSTSSDKCKRTRIHLVRARERESEKRTKHSYQMYRTSFAFLLFVCLFACLLVEFFSHSFVYSFIHSFSVRRPLFHFSSPLSSPCSVNELFFTFIRCSYPCCWFGFVIESIHWMALWFVFCLLLLLKLFIFHFIPSYCPITLSLLLIHEVIYGTHMSFWSKTTRILKWNTAKTPA